jgi:lipoprotein-anchoring transpeptidase ErfK/SrfK
MDRLKDIKNLPLILVLIVVIIIAIVLSILRSSGTIKQTSVNTDNNQEQFKENQSEQKETIVVEIETEENVEEIYDEEKEEKGEGEEQKNQAKYYIKINYAQNVVTIYEKDSKGNYTKAVKAMVCSTGTATPKSGTYSISDKYKWGKLFDGVSGQYCTRIVKSILFHSVPYVTYGDKGSLEYWEYDKLGTKASAGCIRLTVEDAKWIYQNCEKGTQVEFYSDSNPGPLGKPTAQKISGEEAVRGWDPTDPDGNNPWKTYTKEEPEDEIVQENEEKPTTSAKPTTPSKPVNPTNPEPEQPDTPTEPTNPEPEQPDTPTEPTNPEPEQPDTPTDPEPDQPDTPTDPEPDQPDTPIEPEQPDTSTDNQTTDAEITNEKEV